MTKPTNPLIVTPAEAARNLLQCPSCSGIGEVPSGYHAKFGPAWMRCGACRGTGRRALPECLECEDSGLRDIKDPYPAQVYCACEAGTRRADADYERIAADLAVADQAPY